MPLPYSAPADKKVQTWLALIIVLLPTALVWFGATGSGFTVDDYMIIDTQSPISGLTDVLSMFWRNDPNPHYWRPLTNASVSMDFLLWGWNGGMFHVTNLLLHLIATGLVYYLTLYVLRLQQIEAICVALLFGIAACHDANILWIAARADVLATICVMATMLTAFRATTAPKNAQRWHYLSFLFFVLGLASKEVSAVTLALLPVIVWTDTPRQLVRDWKRVARLLTPYFILAVVFLFIRLQFTVSLDEMQPLAAEGSTSPVAFLKNSLYSIGYVLLPLDYRTASVVIEKYLGVGAALAGVLTLAAIMTLWETAGKQGLLRMYKPLMFVLLTGIVAFQSFERWRVYAPSVGVFTIIVILLAVLWTVRHFRIGFRTLAALILLALIGYNTTQALKKQHVWEEATDLVEGYKHDLQQILAKYPERPIRINMLVSPAKYGDAPLMQLMRAYLTMKAEADRKQDPLLAVGSLGSAKEEIIQSSNLEAYLLDPESSFEYNMFVGPQYQRWMLLASTIPRSPVGFTPTSLVSPVAMRDRTYTVDSTYVLEGSLMTVRNVFGAFIQDAEILITDTAAVLVYFDGKNFVELTEEIE